MVLYYRVMSEMVKYRLMSKKLNNILMSKMVNCRLMSKMVNYILMSQMVNYRLTYCALLLMCCVKYTEQVSPLVNPRLLPSEDSQGVHGRLRPHRDLSRTRDPTDSTHAPKDSRDSTDTPMGSRDSTDAPMGSRDSTDTPMDSRDSRDTPMDSRDSRDTPMDSRDSRDTPIDSHDSTDTPMDSHDSTDTPMDSHDSTDTPMASRHPTDTPMGSRDPTDTPKDPRDPTDTPMDSRDPTDTSMDFLDPTDTSVNTTKFAHMQYTDDTSQSSVHIWDQPSDIAEQPIMHSVGVSSRNLNSIVSRRQPVTTFSQHEVDLQDSAPLNECRVEVRHQHERSWGVLYSRDLPEHSPVSGDFACPRSSDWTQVNCSFRHLTSVPTNLTSPGLVTHFDLHNNSIDSLGSNNFLYFSSLQVLDASNNVINRLQPGAFCGLSHLTALNLSGNRLKLSDWTFPEHVFSPLISLAELKLNRNTHTCNVSQDLNYPDQALSKLTSLTSLFMDGLHNPIFGPGFANLTQLKTLSLAGYQNGCCHLDQVSEHTFTYLSQLWILNLSNCYIKGNNIQPGAFSPLRNLQTLDLTHNEDIDVENLDKIFSGLRNISTLTRLELNLIQNRYSLAICLSHFFFRNFPQNLRSLSAKENNLEALDRQLIGSLSPNLETLDVSGNKFVFGTYLMDLHQFKNLRRFKFNSGSYTYSIPTLYPFKLTQRRSSSNCSIYELLGTENEDHLTGTDFILRLPPNLETVEMNGVGLAYVLSALEVDSNNKLLNLSMKNNRFPYLDGPLVGLNSLQYLDLSNCGVLVISETFFLHLTSLLTLKLSENYNLGDFFSGTKAALVFSPLRQLKLLDLSRDNIQNLPEGIFANLSSLQHLYLQHNELTKLSLKLSVTDLNSRLFLNLSNNRISSLSDSMQKDISRIIEAGHNVTLDLSRCPISCVCDKLDFLLWMHTSKAINFKSGQYNCHIQDLTTSIKDKYVATIEALRHSCRSDKILLLVVAGCVLVVLCVILCSILYRFRWKIRYLYYAALLLYNSSSAARHKDTFEYDAFICYDQEDAMFVVRKMAPEMEGRGLKLCVHGRDFRAGEYIASNIVKAVCSSRKTVVVLTRNLMDSYWCQYEVQMANMEAAHTGRSVLLFLIKEDIPAKTISKELLCYIRTNTYLPYPDPLPDATSMKMFWNKLAYDIRD